MSRAPGCNVAGALRQSATDVIDVADTAAVVRLLVVSVQVKPDCVTLEHGWNVAGVRAELLRAENAALWYTAVHSSKPKMH